MPVFRKGSALHSNNVYRLTNANGAPIVTANNIGSHPVYRIRINASNTHNKNHVKMMSNYLLGKLKNYASKNTHQKLKHMVNGVLNHRISNQKGFEAAYLRNLNRVKSRLEPMRIQRRALENANLPTQNINRLIKAEEDAFTAATARWVEHQKQIKYWRWIKNAVVPTVSRRMMASQF